MVVVTCKLGVNVEPIDEKVPEYFVYKVATLGCVMEQTHLIAVFPFN